MRPLAVAALRAGLISGESLQEFRRWGVPVPDVEPYTSLESAVEGLRQALEDETQVEPLTTDLDVYRSYLDTRKQRRGELVLVDPDNDTTARKTVVYVRLEGPVAGYDRYVLPYYGDAITDIMRNGESHLRDEQGSRILFKAVEELSMGSVKAFVVCRGVENDD